MAALILITPTLALVTAGLREWAGAQHSNVDRSEAPSWGLHLDVSSARAVGHPAVRGIAT